MFLKLDAAAEEERGVVASCSRTVNAALGPRNKDFSDVRSYGDGKGIKR